MSFGLSHDESLYSYQGWIQDFNTRGKGGGLNTSCIWPKRQEGEEIDCDYDGGGGGRA